MAFDVDIVSDLNEGTAGDGTVSANTGNVDAHGADTVHVNDQKPVREPAAQAKQVGEPKAPADKPASIRDIISGALKDESATPGAAQQDGRARDPATGKFIEKTAEEVAADAAAAAPPAAAAPVQAAPAGIDPAVFASLPAETQAHLARTMEGVAASQKRFAQLEPIEQLINPRIEAWALNGVQPAQALNQLLALSDFAGRDTPGFIKYIAQQNNVDLEELVLGMVDEPQVDPKIAALEKEIAELKGVTNGFTQQQQQAAHNARVDTVLAFADEKGPDGNVLRPHLSELGDAWLPYINMVKAQNPSWSHAQVLQQAYENACWNHPGVRGKLQATADAAAAAENLRKQAEKTEAARAASVSVRSGVPASPPVAPESANRSIREIIKAGIAAQQ